MKPSLAGCMIPTAILKDFTNGLKQFAYAVGFDNAVCKAEVPVVRHDR